MLLVAGGRADPNLPLIVEAAHRRGVECATLLVGGEENCAITWNLTTDRLSCDGHPLSPRAMFVRHDAFASLDDSRAAVEYRSYGWFTTVVGWCLSHPDVAMLNRDGATRVTNKPFVLWRAARHGLAVPHTVVSNELDRLGAVAGDHPLVVKPVAGGDFCVPFDEAASRAGCRDGLAATPAIVQERLVPPEVRVYRAGDRFLAFEVSAPALDYRTSSRVAIEPRPIEPLGSIVGRLRGLMDELGLDFGAADFKTCASTGELVFLEVNNQPMFAAFDAACEGALGDAIVAALCRGFYATRSVSANT